MLAIIMSVFTFLSKVFGSLLASAGGIQGLFTALFARLSASSARLAPLVAAI